MSDEEEEEDVGDAVGRSAAEQVIAARHDAFAVLGLAHPTLDELNHLRWVVDVGDGPACERVIVNAFRRRVVSVHPDRYADDADLKRRVRAYRILQDARDELMNADKRATLMEQVKNVLRQRKPDGWKPAECTSSAIEDGSRRRAQLRAAEDSKRQEQMRRRVEAEFAARRSVMGTASTGAGPEFRRTKRSRPQYDRHLESDSEDNALAQSDDDEQSGSSAGSVDSETRRAAAVRARQRQRQRKGFR
ncbi:unnamed protein product (mitochondrion) [Plasmodiophora brassicae]|uniref:J domain-containing protein n=1 Tax=Plasmodiophora brassicae TaxID=37360 RepID=A0A0G4IX07_PLABS|nr:hypothetical protein PBRA_007594 [Plasmodiophora brassicae]SPR02052.1 unnamed protein product [Plasmodiophora brassicae]